MLTDLPILSFDTVHTLFVFLPSHDLFDFICDERHFLIGQGKIDKAFNVTTERYALHRLHIGITNVYILLSVYQLPAHPSDHRCVVCTVFRFRKYQGYLMLIG